MNTQNLTHDLTYIAFEAITHRGKTTEEIYWIIVHCNDDDDAASKIRDYFCKNNPFYLLDIENLASSVYWTAIEFINYYELAKQLNDYFAKRDNNVEDDELPY
jgi:hypothetical protein